MEQKMNEGTMLIAIILPMPWPPSANNRLFKARLEEALLEIEVEVSGRLQISMTPQDSASFVFTSQRLTVTGAGLVILVLTWKDQELHIHINGKEILSDQEANEKTAQIDTKNRIILPKNSPLDFIVPNNCNKQEKIFLHTFLDVQKRFQEPNSYNLLKITGLLRLLLLDERPLLHTANREYKLPIRFKIITDPGTLPVPGCNLNFRNIFPMPFSDSKSEYVDLKTFLKTIVLESDNSSYTVKNAIEICANVKGGVHFGIPKNTESDKLSKIDESYQIGDLEVTLQALKGISLSVLGGLTPLVEEILTKHQTQT